MSVPEHGLLGELAKVQYDLTALKARVSEIQRQVAALNLEPPNEHRCGECGVVFRGEPRLAEHRYTSHGGPEPEHWLQSEARSVEPVDEAAEVAA